MLHSAKWGGFPWTGEMMTGQRPLSLRECKARPRVVVCFFSATQWNIITGKSVCFILLCMVWNGSKKERKKKRIEWWIIIVWSMHWPLWCKIYYRPWLEQKDIFFSKSGQKKSGVTRVRKTGVRKSRVTKWRHPTEINLWRSFKFVHVTTKKQTNKQTKTKTNKQTKLQLILLRALISNKSTCNENSTLAEMAFIITLFDSCISYKGHKLLPYELFMLAIWCDST